MKLQKRLIILPIATLTLLGLIHQHANHGHVDQGRSIASSETKPETLPEVSEKIAEKLAEDKKTDEKAPEQKPEDKIKSLEDLVTCQKKIITDLKADMDAKLEAIRQIVADKKSDKPEDKKSVEKIEVEKKVGSIQMDNSNILSVLMHLTQMFQSNQLQAQQSFMPSYDFINPQYSFYRQYYENNMFYDRIGMGRSFLQQPAFDYKKSYSLGSPMGHDSFSPYLDSNQGSFSGAYKNPYIDHGFQQDFGGLDLKRSPMFGDEFNFHPSQGLMRIPSSKGYQF